MPSRVKFEVLILFRHKLHFHNQNMTNVILIFIPFCDKILLSVNEREEKLMTEQELYKELVKISNWLDEVTNVTLDDDKEE